MIIVREGKENQPTWYAAHTYRLVNIEEGHEREGKQYVGVREGRVDMGYVCSAVNEELDTDLATCDFKCIYEKFGTKAAMYTAETTELRKADLDHKLKDGHPDYYNRHVGSTTVTTVDYEDVTRVWDILKTGKYNNPNGELVADLIKLHALQVRVKDNGDLAENISVRLKANGRDTRMCSPILIYEGLGINGQDIIGDGNTTLDGCDRAKAREIRTIRIPKSAVKGWDMGEFRALSNYMNQKDEIEKRPVTEADGVKFIIDLYKNNNVWDDSETYDYLQHSLRFTPPQIKSIMRKARHQIRQLDAAKNDSMLYMDMSPQGKYRGVVNDFAAELNPQYPERVKIWSSAKFNFDQTVNALLDCTVPDPDSYMKHGHNEGRCPPYRSEARLELTDEDRFEWDHFDIIVYHKDEEAEEEWNSKFKADVERKMRTFVQPVCPDITFEIHEMDMWVKNDFLIDNPEAAKIIASLEDVV